MSKLIWTLSTPGKREDRGGKFSFKINVYNEFVYCWYGYFDYKFHRSFNLRYQSEARGWSLQDRVRCPLKYDYILTSNQSFRLFFLIYITHLELRYWDICSIILSRMSVKHISLTFTLTMYYICFNH